MRISDWSSDVCSSDLIGGACDRLAKRRLANPRRADQAQDGRLEFIHPLLHGQVFDNALLDLFQAIVVRVQQDRKSVVEGKSVSVRVDLGGRRIIKKNKTDNK